MGRSGGRIQRYFITGGKSSKIQQNYDNITRLSEKLARTTFSKKMTFNIVFFLSIVIGNVSHADITDPAVKIHKQTNYFIDFEVDVDRLKMDCSLDILGFNIRGDKTSFLFYYRRRFDKALCKQHLVEYQKMLKGAKKVQIVATSLSFSENKKTKKQEVSGPFARMQVGKACKAYFEEDCDLPENYWAGMTPASK